MTEENPKSEDSLTRREVLKSVRKYSVAAAGASVVAVSASQALAQASSSNEWVCTDYYPWWVCWFFGLKTQQATPQYGGWQEFPEDPALPDKWDKTFDTK